jgi:hypothetical protein
VYLVGIYIIEYYYDARTREHKKKINKIGLTPFCFLGPDITLHFSVVAGTGSAIRYWNHEQLGDRSMEIASGYHHT